MNSVIKSSFAIQKISAFIMYFINIWRQGFLYSLINSFKTYYQYSVTKKLWIRFCEADSNIEKSYYYKFLGFLRELLYSIGSLIEQSLFYRLLNRIKGKYFSITKGSVVFSSIHKLSLHQWLLVAFALYLPIEYIIRVKIAFSPLASAWEELFIIVSIVFILWRKALRQTVAIKRETALDVYIILFMAVGLLLMSAVSPYPAIAMAGYRAVVQYMVWFFIILRLIEDDKDFKIVYYAFLGMGALLCLHGIYQYIIAVPIPASWVTQTEMGVRTRVFSLTGSPNIFGSLIVLLAPMAAGMIYYSKKNWMKFIYLCITGIMCLCLLFTFSRGAWVGMVVAVIVFALFIDRRLLVLMAAAIAGVLVFVPSISYRLTYLFTSDYAEASAIGGRALRWEVGRMLLLENNPWLGFGLGRFGGAVAMNNKILDETEEFYYFYMDNYYLKTMVEMGYIGIIFFIILLAALVIWGLRAIYRSNAVYVIDTQEPLFRNIENPKALSVGIFSGLVGVLAHCYFENIFEEPYMMAYFWGLAAMLMYLGFFRRGQLLPNK